MGFAVTKLEWSAFSTDSIAMWATGFDSEPGMALTLTSN